MRIDWHAGRGETGSASAAFLVVVLLISVVSALAVGLGQAHLSRAKAQSAADLAALAAATEREYQRIGYAAARQIPPCELAARTAQRNGAVLIACAEGSAGAVTIEVAVPHPMRIGQAHARAKAGP